MFFSTHFLSEIAWRSIETAKGEVSTVTPLELWRTSCSDILLEGIFDDTSREQHLDSAVHGRGSRPQQMVGEK